MGIRRPSITRKFGKHRFALYNDASLGYREAQELARKLKKRGKNIRIVKLRTGWFVYHYPQYPR